MATRPYKTEGPGGVSSLTPPGSNNVYNYALVAGTAQKVIWPTDADVCNISAAPPYWVKFGGTNTVDVTAAVPVANVTDGSGSALNAAQRKRGGDVSFSIISATAQVISVEWWSSASS